MDRDETLIVGIDICEDFTQIAYFDRKKLEPVSITSEKEEESLIPTKLLFQVETGAWRPELELDEIVLIHSERYDGKELLKNFLKKVFSIMNSDHPYNKIEFICFTFPKVSKILVSRMTEIMNEFGLKGRYSLLDHDEAFFYHTVYRNRDKNINDTAFFELDEDKMTFSILHIDTEASPMSAKISERYVSEDITGGFVRENEEEAVALFENLAFMALERRYISDIYAVGRGFISEWADGVLRKLASGRQVFRGQNLFVKGACYLARERAIKRDEEILFMGADRISAGVSIMAVKDGKETEIILAGPSLKWYEADVVTDIIIKGDDEIAIRIKDFNSKKITRKFLSLSGMNLTGKDLTRIRISVKFKDKDTCVVKAQDLGFGSFVSTTNRIWELTWEK